VVDTHEHLIARSRWLRLALFEMVMRTRRGHIPSSFSCAEILLALFYGGVLRYRRGDPSPAHRDRLIVSKGHAAMALYPILADVGWLPDGALERFTQPAGELRMYADPSIPGIDAISGSLGHGLGIASGFALAARHDGRDQRAFVVLGDGECWEGSVWESALFAAHHRLDNLVAIVDRNRLAILGPTEELVALDTLEAKWRSFGWEAVTVDGHDYRSLLDHGFARVGRTGGRPLAVIAETVKGKGISFMEGRAGWHNRMPDAAEESTALHELESARIGG
jgi:transketolase